MKPYRFVALFVLGLASTTGVVHAQGRGGGRGPVVVVPGGGFKISESAPLEVTQVRNAPFSAQAVTEFTQVLGDGNRIERVYQSSVARDSRGRVRREEEIALVGALAASDATAPRLVTIVDPDAATTYTLDETARVVYRSLPAINATKVELGKLEHSLSVERLIIGTEKGGGGRGAATDQKRAESAATLTENLGTKTIEGVRAEGTRTTTTIPAGAVGNLQPIQIVSERWFSPELQMAVLITRRDPQTGDTAYRLTNIIRGEQPDALFTVPSDYEVKDSKLFFKLAETKKKLGDGLKK